MIFFSFLSKGHSNGESLTLCLMKCMAMEPYHTKVLCMSSEESLKASTWHSVTCLICYHLICVYPVQLSFSAVCLICACTLRARPESNFIYVYTYLAYKADSYSDDTSGLYLYTVGLLWQCHHSANKNLKVLSSVLLYHSFCNIRWTLDITESLTFKNYTNVYLEWCSSYLVWHFCNIDGLTRDRL